MGVGIAMIIIGLVIYIGISALGASKSGPNPVPGSGDVPRWISAVALLGGLVSVIGVVVVVASFF